MSEKLKIIEVYQLFDSRGEIIDTYLDKRRCVDAYNKDTNKLSMTTVYAVVIDNYAYVLKYKAPSIIERQKTSANALLKLSVEEREAITNNVSP